MKKYLYTFLLVAVSACHGVKINVPSSPEVKTENVTEKAMTSINGKYLKDCHPLDRLHNECSKDTLKIDAQSKTLELHFPSYHYRFSHIEIVPSCGKKKADCYCDENKCERVKEVSGMCELTVAADILSVEEVTIPYYVTPKTKINVRIKSNEMKYSDSRLQDLEVRKDYHLYTDNLLERAKAKCSENLLKENNALQELVLSKYSKDSISFERLGKYNKIK